MVWVALYTKEIREHRGVYGGLAVGAILLYTFILTRVEGEAGALFLAGFPVWVTAALLPFALIRSFSGEWAGIDALLSPGIAREARADCAG